jgi:cullin 3
MGLQLFRETIARHSLIKDRLLKQLLANIQRERHGEVVNRLLLKNIIQMLVELGVNNRNVYEEDFEKPFLETSTQFYRNEALQFLNENNCSEYLKKVERRIRAEMDRVEHYLDPQTEPKIKEIVDRELISQHMKTIVEVRQFNATHQRRNTHTHTLTFSVSSFQLIISQWMSCYVVRLNRWRVRVR